MIVGEENGKILELCENHLNDSMYS